MLLSDQPYNFRLKDITKIWPAFDVVQMKDLAIMNNVTGEELGVLLSPNTCHLGLYFIMIGASWVKGQRPKRHRVSKREGQVILGREIITEHP